MAKRTQAKLTRAAVLKAMRLGDREVERLRRVFYQAKVTEYRATLTDLLARYGEHRQVRLSAEIREALQTEADRNARSVVATYNAFVKHEADRWPHLPPDRLASHLAGYLADRGRNRADLIARSEVATARLDAQVAFYRENGVEPTFDLVGPRAKCPICKALKGGGPWPIETVLALGQIHIQCTHSWKARLYSANKLKLGGRSPGRITAGRGGVAGIVNGPMHGGYPTPDAAAAAIEAGRLGEPLRKVWEEAKHPRDPLTGRWIKIGAILDAIASLRPDLKRDKVGGERSELADKVLTGHKDTEDKWSVALPNGDREYDPERLELHDEIVDKFLRQRDSDGKLCADCPELTPHGTKRALFTAGGPSSGKSSVLGQGYDGQTMVGVNPDDVKAELHEYQALARATDRASGAAVHEESSALSKRILREALDRDLNIFVDTVGDSEGGKFHRKLREAVDRGYEVKVVVATLPVELGQELALERALRTGRFVPPDFIDEAYQAVAARHTEWRDDPDLEWEVWNTGHAGASKGAPVLAARSPRGETEPTVEDPSSYEAFIQQAGAEIARGRARLDREREIARLDRERDQIEIIRLGRANRENVELLNEPGRFVTAIRPAPGPRRVRGPRKPEGAE